MKWITAFDLDAWAGRTSSRLAFPRLIADLIRASADDIGAFRFPNGEMGQVPGFDGLLESDDGVAPYVPQGRSIWEFGTNADAIAKVDADYDKRTAQVSDEDRAETTFVFVTPRTWKTPKKKIATWVAAKVKAKKWKDVRFIDGVQLESWLDSHPAVAAHWARQELKLTPSRGARGTDEFWRQYSRRFKPPLSEDVVLCSRQAQADKLVEALIRGDQQIKLMADSPEEVIAFAVAAIRKADATKRAFLEARTLVIDTAEAASELIQKDGLIFLPRGTAYSEVGSLSEKGPISIARGSHTCCMR